MLTKNQEENAIKEILDDLRKIGDSVDIKSIGSHYDRLSKGRKEGRAISRSNADIIKTHVDSLHKAADLLHGAADDLATILQGSETPYAGSDPGTPADGQQEGKNRGMHSSTQGYEVKAFDKTTCIEKERQSFSVPKGSIEWIAGRFCKSMEKKMGVSL